MDKKKLAVLITLSLLAVWALISASSDSSKVSLPVSGNYFAFADTNAITKIEINKGGQQKAIFTLNNRRWILNNKYLTDKDNISKYFFVLANVKVKRMPQGKNAEELKDKLKNNGLEVKIYTAAGVASSFVIDDGSLTSSTCMMKSEESKPYFVELEGVSDNFGHIFDVNEQVWASRRLFASSLRTLQSIEIKAKESKWLKLVYDQGFFKIDGVSKPDTNAIGSYLIQYRDVHFDAYLPDSIDSRVATDISKAIYTLKVEDLDSLKNNTLYVFDLPSNPNFWLGRQRNNAMPFLISKRKLKPLLVQGPIFNKP